MQSLLSHRVVARVLRTHIFHFLTDCFLFAPAVDAAYLSAHGIMYANTPTAVSDPTATTTLQLMFQTVRASSQAEAVVRRGEWRRGLQSTPDLRDMTIGIIGMGTIGKVREF